jgi:ribosome-associated heat shock protein Hsp15
MASDACRSGKVQINDQEVKPSREVKIQDVVKVRVNPQFTRTLVVLKSLSNRVGAKLVPEFANDITPPEEFEKLKLINEMNAEKRDRGIGRPTKKERRMIDKLKDT